jgi:hypothetical protein
MMNIDLPVLVNQALLSLGCDPALISNLDGHSTITLDFDQQPSLMIVSKDDQVWVWSRVAEFSDAVLAYKAHEILQELMRSDDTILGGHPSLCEGEGYLELRALLAPGALENAERMGEALSLFFERMTRMSTLIAQ